jgi:hypothetical protein
MRALYALPLLLTACLQADQPSDRAAILNIIVKFNDPHQRASVLARDADLPPLDRAREPGVSPLYYEAKEVRFVTPDVAFVDAVESQYGSLIMKRSRPACFVLRRESGEWRIAVLR